MYSDTSALRTLLTRHRPSGKVPVLAVVRLPSAAYHHARACSRATKDYAKCFTERKRIVKVSTINVIVMSFVLGAVVTALPVHAGAPLDLLRGEAPYASHLLYTQPGVFNDDDPGERQHGIDAGLAWGDAADAVVVYEDLGHSRGMAYSIRRHKKAGRTVELRRLPGWSQSAPVSDSLE